MTNRNTHNQTPPPAAEPRLSATLAPRLARLADDTWVLAQRVPALAADPALVTEAGRLLTELRRTLCREPDSRLLPQNFAPGIGLHALALSLRQMQAAIALFIERHPPAPGRASGDEIDDITRITALVLRRVATGLAERHNVTLPPELRGRTPPPPPPPPGRPPQPHPAIRRIQLRRANKRRRQKHMLG